MPEDGLDGLEQYKTIIPKFQSLEESYSFKLEYYYAYLDMILNKIIDARNMELIYE